MPNEFLYYDKTVNFKICFILESINVLKIFEYKTQLKHLSDKPCLFYDSQVSIRVSNQICLASFLLTRCLLFVNLTIPKPILGWYSEVISSREHLLLHASVGSDVYIIMPQRSKKPDNIWKAHLKNTVECHIT